MPGAEATTKHGWSSTQQTMPEQCSTEQSGTPSITLYRYL